MRAWQQAEVMQCNSSWLLQGLAQQPTQLTMLAGGRQVSLDSPCNAAEEEGST